MRRAVASICSTVASFPSPAARSSSSLGIVSQRKYERRLAISNCALGLFAPRSMRNRKCGDWSMASITIEAPAWKFLVRPASSRNKPE